MSENMIRWQPRAGVEASTYGSAALTLLDTASTAFGRATAYNTRQEQEDAEKIAHGVMLDLDRTLYMALLCLPGVNDRAMQMGARMMLASQPENPVLERRVLAHWLRTLPPQRMIKLFHSFSARGENVRPVNNSRTRKLVLETLIGDGRFEFWSVKYREKIRAILNHCLGRSIASAIRETIRKEEWSASEVREFERRILRFAGDNDKAAIAAAVGYALGVDTPWQHSEIISKVIAARSDLEKGAGLPVEVLEGIRSTYHSNVPHSEVLELSKRTMTKGQKLQRQRSAKKAGVEIEVNPLDYDAIKLLLYAMEMGYTADIGDALRQKAKKAAEKFPMRIKNVGIVIDASASSNGSKEQPKRPLATILATANMLSYVATSTTTVVAAGGADIERTEEDIYFAKEGAGPSDLASAFVSVMRQSPDAVFVLTDGYENCPEGMLRSVAAAWPAQSKPSIYQLTPALAAERLGIRELAPEIPAIPVSNPEAIGVAMLRAALTQDPIEALKGLVGMASLPALQEA